MSQIVQLYSDDSKEVKAYPKTLACQVFLGDGETTVEKELKIKAAYEIDSTTNVNIPMIDEKLEQINEQYEELTSSKIPQLQEQLDSMLLNPIKLGASGNGEVNDTKIFTQIESMYSNHCIELLNKTYLIDELPMKNKYQNGYFKLSTGAIREAEFVTRERVDASRIFIGNNAGGNSPKYRSGESYNLINIGPNSMSKGDKNRNSIAIGSGALLNCNNGRYNVALGLESLYYTTGVEGDTVKGTRNTALGDNTARFNTTGYGNVAIGRNSLQANDGDKNIAIGIGAMSGNCPLDVDSTIINPEPTNTSDNLALGVDSLYSINSNLNLALGNYSLREAKNGSKNLAIGHYALSSLEKNKDIFNKSKVALNINGRYSWSGQTMTINAENHGLEIGDKVLVRYTSGKANEYVGRDTVLYNVISIINSNEFTFEVPKEGTSTGDITLIEKRSGSDITHSNYNTVIGTESMKNSVQGTSNTVIGFQSSVNNIGNENVATGMFTLLNATNTNACTALGYRALSFNDPKSHNTAIGHLSSSHIRGQYNTSIGAQALRFMHGTSGTVYAEDFNNCTGIGFDAQVTGDNQVQLGNSTTTTYVFGTVQNRSDARDKADIRDTVLGLDFIKKLRPVDYKWNLREDYNELIEEEDANGEVSSYKRSIENDGSKKRRRYHHGLIAQEIAEVIKESGVDFGGFQDHSINGGSDTLSIGYDELIAPLIKAVQELAKEVEELKNS